MALTPSFTSSESLSSPNLITFNDTSTGSDSSITTRYIFVQLSDGSYLVPAGTTTDYIVWDYADLTITVDLLKRSQAANVTVLWYANTGSQPVYTVTTLLEWDLYDYLFLFGNLQTQTSNPNVINDSSFYPNTLAMIVNLFQSENAVLKMNDVYSSQAALDRNYELITYQSYAF